MAAGEWSRKWRLYVYISVLLFVVGASEDVTPAEMTGVRVEGEDAIGVKDGMSEMPADTKVPLRLFGRHLTSGTTVAFTTKNGSRDGDCNHVSRTDSFTVDGSTVTPTSALVEVTLPENAPGDYFLVCVKDVVSLALGGTSNDTATHWRHQGDDLWNRIHVIKQKTTILPIYLQIMLIVLLLVLSGLFSGLNLGLMSLDKTELKIIESVGSPRERKYAKVIMPLRKRGNFLLCTILLGNVLVNNTLTILLDDLSGSGPVAIVAATLFIVVFGEIIPQAVCSRYGLAIGAKTVWVTRLFMFLTFPLSFPISKILDLILGEEIGNYYNRDRLRELLRVTQDGTDLKKDEVNIITGALELSRKTVKDVLTKIEDVYMIEYNSILDFETISDIMKTGFTRVPVYDGERTNVTNMLNIKDLAFVDPDDATPLKTVLKFYNHPVIYVFEDTKLDEMLEDFKKGRSHMSVVQRVNNEGEGDPFYETVGVVTLEDVIEEIIQSEIIDETDTITDNRKKAPRQTKEVRDFSVFNQPDAQNMPRMSPQLSLATFQYLSTCVDPFREEYISETVLGRMIKQNVVINLKLSSSKPLDAFIYTRGRACDYFVLILQGRVEVDVGKEHMVFEGGPFMYFGIQALLGGPIPNSASQSSEFMSGKNMSALSLTSTSDSIYTKSPYYAPDFNVKALTDLQYLCIRRAHYIAARRATLMERHPKTPQVDPLDDPFAKEWKKATSLQKEEVGVPGTEITITSVDTQPQIQTPGDTDTMRGSKSLIPDALQNSALSSSADNKSDHSGILFRVHGDRSRNNSVSSVSGSQKLIPDSKVHDGRTSNCGSEATSDEVATLDVPLMKGCDTTNAASI